MGVDHVELAGMLHRDGAAHLGVARHLLEEVGAVLAGKLEFLPEADGRFLRLLALHFFNGFEILLRIDVGDDIRIHVDEFHFVQEFLDRVADMLYGDIARIQDGGAALILVSRRGRHHEERLHPVVGETLHDALAGCTEATGDVRRELPAEHQNFHYLPSLYLSNIYSMVRSAAVLSAEEMAPCGS